MNWAGFAANGAAIAQATTQAYGDGVAEAAANRSVILDFEVDNVDAEYERLQDVVSDWMSIHQAYNSACPCRDRRLNHLGPLSCCVAKWRDPRRTSVPYFSAA
jgi:hypothetical protein